jgi:hypothetical protein
MHPEFINDAFAMLCVNVPRDKGVVALMNLDLDLDPWV